MNYNKHLEQLNTFLDEIRNTQQTIDGLGIELGNYIVEVEKMRDDADRSGGKIPPEEFSTKRYTQKAFGKKDDDVIKADPVNEALDNWYKKLIKV